MGSVPESSIFVESWWWNIFSRAWSKYTYCTRSANEHIDKTYFCRQNTQVVDDHIECVFAKLHLNGQTYIVGVVYRPPNSNIVDFNDTMLSILEKVTRYPCYIMGDFNLDLLKHDKHPPTEKFLDIMHANSFIPIINWPTSVTRDTCTLIDNIYTNSYNIKNDNYSGLLTTDISDHFPVFHLSKKMQWTFY